MLIIQNNNLNPYFNIASEEYLLKNFKEDIFMLYINNPSIIVGKHQNALAEINFPFVQKNKIPVVRRLSGGGTVYHDSGNLNFAFFQNGSEGNLVNFKKFTEPIISVLHSLGIDAKLEGKNDLRVDGLKISGNAEHVFKNRVIHHGTLLFNSELDELRGALKVSKGKYIDKAVQSIRSSVTNIHPYLQENISTNQFKEKIENFIKETNSDCRLYKFSEEDILKIDQLQMEKFNTWEWNFGYSPNYEFQNEILLHDFKFRIRFRVVKGLITETEVTSGDECVPQNLTQNIIGKHHNFEDIYDILVQYFNLEPSRDEESILKSVYQFF